MGAPIAGREKQDLAAALDCTVRESWGNSESLGTITDDEMLRECPDSIGRPFLGDFMCIVDDNGDECPTGAVGRLAGGQLAGFTRYTARPTDTLSTKRRGLIISEDLGWCDSRGRFFIGGRLQERIRVGDQDVFLPKLEDELRAHGLAAPFCLTHRTADDVIELGLLFESGTITESQVRASLEDISSPLSIARIAAVAALPRTASGKVDRAGAANILWPTA
jgi:acyl-coenzyme A synthetase/AMP-(fatty) acid ligase